MSNIKWVEVNSYEEMSKMAAAIFTEQIKNKPKSIIGLATGSTPEGLYKELIKLYNAGELSLRDVTTFNLDEYVGLHRDDKASYWTYMHENLFNHIDLDDEQIHLPKGDAEDLAAECAAYEAAITAAGGIDLQLLGIGVNGHVGFNEPGTSFDSLTHVVELTESTREANKIYFDNYDAVPTLAVTMGIQTIMNAKQVVLVAFGESKAEAMARLKSGVVTEDMPASQLCNHPNVTVFYGK